MALTVKPRAMAAILDHYSDRLNAGAKSDLLALSKIAFVKSRTARVFYENGFKTVAAIANAEPKELVPILIQVCWWTAFIPPPFPLPFQFPFDV